MWLKLKYNAYSNHKTYTFYVSMAHMIIVFFYGFCKIIFASQFHISFSTGPTLSGQCHVNATKAIFNFDTYWKSNVKLCQNIFCLIVSKIENKITQSDVKATKEGGESNATRICF